MENNHDRLIIHHEGDKVKIKSGPYAGQRGVVKEDHHHSVSVQISGTSDDVVMVDVGNVTNYSLAARRAWAVMPKRAGRPPASSGRKKTVSVRIDSEVWNRLAQAVEQGLIPSREEILNSLLRRLADALDAGEQIENVEKEIGKWRE